MRESEWQSRPFVQELRHNQTPAEKVLWQDLRARRLAGFKFRRQHPIDCFIVDFACLSENLAIEIDGSTHLSDEAKAYDTQRTDYLNKLGWHIMRFSNHDIHTGTDGVIEAIYLWLKGEELAAPPSERFAPTSPFKGGGCP
ncbi:endonuclease domain-containing protein [Hellea balneolensis]|uniref:endonuclease domain-containing protein n=1 Tax=Hellea balneolensis TaxID=287478 RepID=UPI00055914FE|nr:endonuclease domain-containing protein [Hellea balneolensis]